MNKIAALSILLLGNGFSAEPTTIPTQGNNQPAESTPTQDLMDQLISNYTVNNLTNFYSLLYSDLAASRQERTENLQFPSTKIAQLIFNQDGYDDDVEILPPELNGLIGNKIHIGNPLTLEDGTPIGYNITLPVGDIKASIVSIYGGFSAENRKQKLYKPMALSALNEGLLSQGIAIITLNLPDLLTPGNSQHETSLDLFNKLHQSINKFYEVIHSIPEQLNPNLETLKGKPIFLYGASFGGQRSIRHAELYPGTYSGYISLSGAISTLLKKHMTPKADEARKWLFPMENNPNSDSKISAIQDPILLIHSYDDNNVPIQISLDWYKKAKKVGKEHLIQVFFPDRGNSDLGILTPTKGHSIPTDQVDFDKTLSKISSFILSNQLTQQQLNQQSQKTEGQVKKMKMLSARNNAPTVGLQELFLSEAYRLFKTSSKQTIDTLTARSISDPQQQEAAWKLFYEPLYYSLAYLDKIKGDQTLINDELNTLQSQGLLTPKHLSRALTLQLYPFTDYLKEHKKVNFPKADIPKASDSSSLQERFKQILLAPTLVPTQEEIELETNQLLNEEDLIKKMLMGDKVKKHTLQMTLLELLYTSNLDLIKPKIDALKQDSALRQREDEMKAKFLSRVQKIYQK